MFEDATSIAAYLASKAGEIRNIPLSANLVHVTCVCTAATFAR